MQYCFSYMFLDSKGLIFYYSDTSITKIIRKKNRNVFRIGTALFHFVPFHRTLVETLVMLAFLFGSSYPLFILPSKVTNFEISDSVGIETNRGN
jgi:hypothetical protein